MANEKRGEWAALAGLVLGAALVLSVLVAVVSWPIHAQQPPQAPPPIPLTELETTQLRNLQLRLQVLSDEYTVAMYQLKDDAAIYRDKVLAAHPGDKADFDLRTLSWIRRVGAPAASGNTNRP